MSGQRSKGTVAGLLEALFWPALLAVTLLVVVLVARWLLSLELDAGFWQELDPGWVLLALLAQGLCAGLVVLSWKWILELNGATGITHYHAVAMIGLNAIGKYAPGKVVGVLARGAWLLRRNHDAGIAVRATLVEQTAMLHVGAVLTLLAWLIKESHRGTALLLLPVALLSVFLVARWGSGFLEWAMRLLRRPAGTRGMAEVFARSYHAACCSMLAIWIMTVLTVYCCILAFGHAGHLDPWWMLWVVTLAYLGGFVAFFLPAGIGAREGVMAFLLGAQLELGLAVYVAVLHRLVTLVIDCMLGCVALVQTRDLPDRMA